MQEQYIELCKKIKALEEEKKELGEKIMQDMIDRREKKEMFTFGTFSVGIRKKFKYSSQYLEQEANTKLMKKQEELVADWDESPYLVCSLKKD